MAAGITTIRANALSAAISEHLRAWLRCMIMPAEQPVNDAIGACATLPLIFRHWSFGLCLRGKRKYWLGAHVEGICLRPFDIIMSSSPATVLPP
jgi:spore cortex formation protein SpoVR/YcgB (stage V sporulation)